MEARAEAKHIRVSPRKARLVLALIRGMNAGEALNLLRFTKKRVARQVARVLKSAIANAESKGDAKSISVDLDSLFVSEAYANDGGRGKRFRPAPMGRAHPYVRRPSHIIVRVAEKKTA